MLGFVYACLCVLVVLAGWVAGVGVVYVGSFHCVRGIMGLVVMLKVGGVCVCVCVCVYCLCLHYGVHE